MNVNLTLNIIQTHLCSFCNLSTFSLTQFPQLLSLSFPQARSAAARWRPDSHTKFGLPHYLLAVAYLGFHKGGGQSLPSLPSPSPSLPFPPLPPLPLPSLPLPLEVGPLIAARGSGERFSSPSGSGRSPAAKRYLVNFRLIIWSGL